VLDIPQSRLSNRNLFPLCYSGWFGPNEIKSFDPASAEKAKLALKKGNALKVAIGEALDPSLLVARNETDNMDESDDGDKEPDRASPPSPEQKKVSAAKTKTTGTKKRRAGREQDEFSENEEPHAEKKRRPSTSEDQELKSSAKRAPAAKPTAKVTAQKKKAPAGARNRQDSDTKSIDENTTTTPTNSSLSRKSQDETENSGEQARAKKKIRSTCMPLVL